MSPKESEKIGAVYKDEKQRLLGYIRRRTPDWVEPEDILQDVFYQLTVGFRDVRNIENLTAWLYRVADNRITDTGKRGTSILVITKTPKTMRMAHLHFRKFFRHLDPHRKKKNSRR
jgi:DNA-directed RNA polymerase specialized sigma24 family protein